MRLPFSLKVDKRANADALSMCRVSFQGDLRVSRRRKAWAAATICGALCLMGIVVVLTRSGDHSWNFQIAALLASSYEQL